MNVNTLFLVLVTLVIDTTVFEHSYFDLNVGCTLI